jgi:hypothetical protein
MKRKLSVKLNLDIAESTLIRLSATFSRREKRISQS